MAQLTPLRGNARASLSLVGEARNDRQPLAPGQRGARQDHRGLPPQAAARHHLASRHRPERPL